MKSLAAKVVEGDSTSAISLLVSRIWATGCLSCLKSSSQSAISRHCPTAAIAYHFNQSLPCLLPPPCSRVIHTCFADSCFGLCSMSSRLNPIPMAPDDTRITRWPSRRNRTHVSTIRDKLEMSGSWVFSSQMEDVPATNSFVS